MSDSVAVPRTDSVQVKSKGSKSRKKDDCNVQHVLRALNSLTTPEEKLAAMCKKYADLFDENRKLQSDLKQFQKEMTTVIKEKEQLRTDIAKSVLTRSRLESLCRELQRQNKFIKEDSLQKIKEEEEKRKEVSAKFQVTLNEITELMKQDSDKTMKLRDDNIDMTSKLKSVYEQYEIREQEVEKMTKRMQLESQLYATKVSKLEMEAAGEKEALLREKKQLLTTLTEYQDRIQEHQNMETALRNQITVYNNKYEEFEKSLSRSNQMFGGFKEEVESMSNKIVKLESETTAWKLRWEKTQKALLEMASEKQKSDQETLAAARKVSALQKLCQTLQSERAQLLSKLKDNNIPTCSDSSTDSPASEEVPTTETQLTSSKKGIEKTEPCCDSKACNKNSEAKINKDNVKGITKTKPSSSKGEKLEIKSPESHNATLSDVHSPTDLLLNGSNATEVQTTKPEDIKADTAEPSPVQNVPTEEVTQVQNVPEVTQKPAFDMTQLTFPQTETFSFTYNGNILNELKSEVLPESKTTTLDLVNEENSKEFVLKKPTHSSKQKISPRKKSKK